MTITGYAEGDITLTPDLEEDDILMCETEDEVIDLFTETLERVTPPWICDMEIDINGIDDDTYNEEKNDSLKEVLDFWRENHE
jgi:hypothetical protein